MIYFRRRKHGITGFSKVFFSEEVLPMFNPVTSLAINAGAAPTAGASGNHIVVYDQLQRALSPAGSTWALATALEWYDATPD